MASMRGASGPVTLAFAGPRSAILLLAASAVLGTHEVVESVPESNPTPLVGGMTLRDPEEEALFSLGALGSRGRSLREKSSRRLLQSLADCPDLNSDGEVNVSDCLLALSAFGGGTGGDIDGDGDTDVADILVLLGGFGRSCASEPRTCNPPFAGADHPCRGDHSYVGAVFVNAASSAAACQAACLADVGCTGGSFFDGDQGTEQWRGMPRQAIQADGCHLYGAAGAWAHFHVCPEHWSIYSNPAVSPLSALKIGIVSHFTESHLDKILDHINRSPPSSVLP